MQAHAKVIITTMKLSFAELIDAYLTDALSPEEEAAFIAMLEDPEARAVLQKIMAEKAAEQLLQPVGPEAVARRERGLYALQRRLQLQHLVTPTPVHRLRWWWAAASVLIVLAVGLYFLLSTSSPPALNRIVRQAGVAKDIAPGKNGALLTLANGSQVALDSASNGIVTIQNGAQVLLKNGQLQYTPISPQLDQVTWNMISTSRGRQFMTTLRDGTKVWLNAASSIRFPTSFPGRERAVFVTGEVYFEVAKNTKQPFHVTINDNIEIDVLGTAFNINAYTNEPFTKTTLLEGAMRVRRGLEKAVLQPGQQAIVTDAVFSVQEGDATAAVAWKNGVFELEGVGTTALMRQLARWYDLELIYQGEPPQRIFHGKLGRDLRLSQVLEVLSQFNITYNLEGRRLTIK